MGSLFDLKKELGITGSAGSAAQSSAQQRTGGLFDLKEQLLGVGELANSFKRYSDSGNTVARYLQSDSWDDNRYQQQYAELVSRQQKEIADAMKAAKGNSLISGKLQEYADWYDSLAKGLGEREAFYSQFQSKADYDSYSAALSGAREAVAAGGRYDDWYQTAQTNAKNAADEVTRLENEMALLGLQQSSGLWDEYGNYLGEDPTLGNKIRTTKEALEQARLAQQDANRQAQYAGAWRWEDLPGQKDYYKNAAAGLGRFEEDIAAEKARQEAESAPRAEAYDAMGAAGSGAGAYEDDLMTQLRNDTRWREPQDDWSEQERNTFGYLYAEDPEKAYEYGQYINDRNAALSRYEKEQSLEEWADKNFFTRAASFGAGVLTMPTAIVDYLNNAAEYAARGTVTQKDYLSAADAGNLMVGAVSEGMNERHGTIDSKLLGEVGLGDLYQLGVSVAQSMAWGHVLGAAGTSVAFFGSAAKSGFEEAKARGADDGKALWYGFAAGVAEAGCEYFSLDKLLSMKTPTSFTDVMLNVLTQSGIEGSEEFLTTFCNRISDDIINGDKSQISTDIALGMAKGMSYADASKAAERKWLQGLAKDAVGGFLSGGISGMIETGVQSFGQYSGNSAQLIDQGLAAGGEAETMARDLSERWNRFTQEDNATSSQSAEKTAPLAQGSQSAQPSPAPGRTVEEQRAAQQDEGAQQTKTQERESEAPAGKKDKTVRVSKLEAQRLIEAIQKEDRGKIRQAVEAQLEQMQEGVNEPGKDLSLIAEAVTKKTMGKDLTRREGEALANSHFGEYLLRQLDTGAIMRSGRIAQWVKEIGAERVGGGLYSDVAEVVRSTLRGEGLKSTQGRVSLGGERVTFTRLERAADGSVKALVTRADGSTQQVPVSEIDFGYNSLLGETVKELAALPHGPAMLAYYDPGQNLGGYIDAWQIGEIYGSRSGATLENAWADAGRAIQQDIRYEQFRQAFEMGRREREQRIAEREKARKATPQSAEQTAPLAQGSQSEKGSQSEGKVTFDGAEIDGVKYDAVDKSRLTSRQKRQIAALEELAKVTGVNIVFYQTRADSKGRFRGANGAFFNNTIYLDVNAGMRDSRDDLRVAIIRTAAHELTHYIKENNAEGYEALQSFLLDRLIEWKGRSLAELAQDKLARDTSGTLSMEQAIDEVVADGCEMMLRRSSVAEQLARENKSLFERISDWVKGWTQKIRDAFEGVEAYHDEAKAMEQHAAELQKRWDAALLGAIRNDRSGQGTKNTAPEGGAQMQERDETISQKEIEALRSIRNDHKDLGRVSIFDFTSEDTRKAEKWARRFYKEMGNKSPFFRRWFGEWRAYDTSGVRYLEMKNDTVNRKTRAVYNKDMTKASGERGMPVILGKDFFEDSLHYAKRGKDEKAITKLLANIDEVIENAVLLDTRLSDLDSRNKKGTTQFMHILYAPITYNAAPFLAKITVEEYREDGILRAYNAQRIKMSALPRSHFQQLNQTASAGNSRLHTDEIMISQLYDLVKQHDDDFKSRPDVDPAVLYEDGTPKVFYHGTASDFWAFDMKKATDKTGRLLGLGAGKGKIYLTEYEAGAKMAASGAASRTRGGVVRVLPLYVRAEKIMDRAAYKKLLDKAYENYPNSRPGSDRYDYKQRDKAISDVDRTIRKQGYDAVMDYESGELFVFKNTQLKSATDNIGTFDLQNTDIRYQERDFMPDDRELLLEAAEGGQGSAELQEYRKKARKLEEHQRRLQRLQEAAESAEGAEKDKITEKLRKTERSILNAEAALRRMEATPQLKRALEKATAAWRDANPNEAAQTLRRLREQNRTQQELIEYWQQQARRTEPGRETLRKDDIRRVARALLKEHGSEADVDQVSRLLQELGDFMTQNMSGAGVGTYEEIKRRAGRIARVIVGSVYQTEDSHAELRQEVRDYLRNTPIQITDYIRQDMPELDYFRKKNMGVLRLNREGASLDEVYQSLGDQFGERWFPRDVTAPSDQLNQIVDALQSLEPSYYEMYRDYEAREVSEIVAGEIIDTLLSGDVRQSETVADRAYRQMQESLQRETEKQRQRLQDEKALRRKMVSEKVHELRERSITRDKEYKARIRIAKAANRLAKYLTENSKEKHVPEKFKAAVGQLLLSVDTLSPRAGEKTQQMYIRQMNEIRRAVASNLAFMNGSESDWKGMLLDLPQDLAEVMEQHIDSVQAAIDGDKTWTTSQMNLQQLQELEEILTVLSKAITQQNELLAGERGRTVSATAEETVKYLDALERAKGDRKLRRFLEWDNTTPYYFFKRFGPAGLQIFREMQNGWGTLAFNGREIIDFANKTYSAKEAREAEKKIYSFQLHKRLLQKTEDGDDSLRSKEKETVRMSKAQVMELYALSRRQQALGHILGAGIRISDIQEGTKKITQADNYLLTQEELNEITGVLSERDREIVEALQRFMNTRGTEWGNEVSMARFGIRQFTEENYWPISTDPRGRALRDPGRDSTNLFRLLNMGFTKNTIRDANNSLVLGSVFDTFANHMADMAKYNALGLPLLDAMKWYSYNAISEQNEESGQYTTVSMQKSAEGALGQGATAYFVQFMKDMNGTQEGGRGEEFAAKMLSNYKVASVAANLRVAMLQPTAYVRAAVVLDPKYLAKGVTMGNKQGREKAMKYSGTAVWKDLGFYDTNINAGLREMIKHTDSLADQIREKSMILAEWGDKMTWGYLWNACEAEVAEKQHLRGEELMRATAQRFDDVIYQTQVMDSTMTRSQNMRQKGVFAGMATSFMSEPTLSYNMVLDAYNEFRTEKRRSGSGQRAWRKTRGKLARAMLAYAATAAAAAVVESAADAWRDDDEYASFTEKWLEKMGFTGKFKDFWDGNLWSDLAIHNKLPYLRDFDSMLHGFETNRLDMEWMKSLKKAYEILSETVKLQTGAIDAPTDATYNGRMTTWGKIYNVMKAVSQLSGLPFAAAGREITAIWNNTVGQFGSYRFKTYDPGPEKSIRYALQDGYLSEEEAQKLLVEEQIAEDMTDARQMVYEWGLNGAGKYDDIYEAVKADDQKSFQKTLAELQELGYAEKNILSAVKTQIREWYQGTEKNPRSIEKAQASKLLQKYAGMRSRDADELVQEWACYVVTGMQYGDMKEAYLDGELSNSQAMDRMKTFGGKDQDEARAAVLKWQCEKDTGIPYADVREAYVYKEISETQARSMLKKYGQMDEKSINQAIAVCDFAGTDKSLSEITGASALYYFDSVQVSGIDKRSWLKYWSDTKEISGDDKQKQIIDYIDALNLTAAQKDVIFRFHYRNSEKTLKKTPWHQ